MNSSLSVSGFNDNEAWEQDDDLDIHNDPMMSLNTSTPAAKIRSRNSSLKKSPHSSSTPPTSNLVTKLFPQLKTKVNAQTKVKGAASPEVVVAKVTRRDVTLN